MPPPHGHRRRLWVGILGGGINQVVESLLNEIEEGENREEIFGVRIQHSDRTMKFYFNEINANETMGVRVGGGRARR